MNHSESIEHEIVDAQRNLGRQLSEAGERVREVIDWKTHYRRNPAAMLAAAAAAGFVLSSLTGERASSDDEHSPRRATSRGSSAMNNATETMLDALVATASIKAAEYIEQWLPGFHQEFTRRQGLL
jgi:hypothetical protein